MRLALLTLALALPAASAAAPPSGAAAHRGADRAAMPSRLCGNPLKMRPVRSPEAAKARPLGELSPGALTLTVLNRVGGCIEPVTVRQGYGGSGGR